MKKLLWIVFILLFLGVGFLYVIKNPTLPISNTILTTLGITIPATSSSTGIDLTNCSSYFDGWKTCKVKDGKAEACTRMFCETPAEPQCLEYVNTGADDQWTGIDLTNCVSYFDGCNNCTVENGKPSACTLMYCETPGTPKCTQYATGTVGIANPASSNCVKNWWTLNIVEWTGGQVGMCTLANGTVCEERAYMRGECGTSATWSEASPSVSWDAWTICTMEYAPVCASVQVQCIKAPCPPIEQTFGNKCQMNANKHATFLHEGECVTK